MRKLYRGLVLVAALGLLSGAEISVYKLTSGYLTDDDPHRFIGVMEKASINDVRPDPENPSALLVDVKWVNSTGRATDIITFTAAVVRNATSGVVVSSVSLDNVELLPDAEITVKVVMEDKLPGGKYTVALATYGGSAFVSPEFIQP